MLRIKTAACKSQTSPRPEPSSNALRNPSVQSAKSANGVLYAADGFLKSLFPIEKIEANKLEIKDHGSSVLPRNHLFGANSGFCVNCSLV